MSKLLIRMLRDIKNNMGQFMSIVFIIAIGAAMFSGMLSAILSIDRGVNRYYKEQKLADIWVAVKGITEEEIEELDTAGGSEAEGRYITNLEATYQGMEISLRSYSLTGINQVELIEGRLPESDYECIVDSKFAKVNNISIGDTLELIQSSGLGSNSPNPEVTISKTKNLRITGIADNPEHAFKVKDGATTQVSHRTYAIVYSTKATMIDILRTSEAYLEKEAEIKARFPKEDKRKEALKELDESFLSYQEILITTDDADSVINLLENKEYLLSYTLREDQASYSMVQGGVDTISTVSYIFPVVFFLVAALILLISMAKMVENQRTQIAVMEALGIRKGMIRSSYVFYAGAASAAGSLLFAYIGHLIIPRFIIKMFTNRFSVGHIEIISNPYLIIAPFLLSFLLSGVASALAVNGLLKLAPAQAMRPKTPKKSKTIAIEKITPLWKSLNYSAKIILRNLFLNKIRVLLSSIGIICSVMLMITGLSLQYSAESLLQAKADSMAYDLTVIYNKPIEDKTDLAYSVDTEQVELTKILKATLPQYGNEGIAVQLLQENSQLIQLFDEKDEPLFVEADSVFIPHTLADEYGIKIGDFIEIQMDEVNSSVAVTGISVQYTGNMIYLGELAAEKAGIDVTYNTALLKLSDSEDTTLLLEELEGKDTVRAVNTRMDITGAAADNLQMLNAIIVIIIVAAVIMSMAVIYNITAINLFERAREFATLMVLGYYKKEVNRLLLYENMVVTIIGCIGGLPCGMILFKFILGSFSDSGVLLPSSLSIPYILLTYLITLLFSLLTNLFMKKRIRDIDMIEALKGVE